MNQKTIQSDVTLSGAGLHTGQKTTVTFKPALAGAGISFVRVDLPQRPQIRVCPSSVVMNRQVSRCTVVASGDAKVSTIEHVLAALNGMGIDNLTIEIDGQEVPGLDGSALDFWNALSKVGTVEQRMPKEVFSVKEPIVAANETGSIMIAPSDRFSVGYTLDYDHPAMRSQFLSIDVDGGSFGRQLAPARTFCLDSEAAEIQFKGLGKGANRQNTLVMSAKGPLDNQLRFPDECVRHKVLDIVGDLYLLGYPVKGRVSAVKSGHSLNRQLVRKIAAQRQKYAQGQYVPLKNTTAKGRVFDIQEIMRILPHRYPFLLVDRVIEVEPGTKGIGIKNVTINDGFFQGHFPSKPVMPGVLMVEAMAQTAGVVILTSGAHNGKVALFMSISEVKFRKVVVPGDQLIMEVEIVRDRGRTARVNGVGKVNDEIVVEAQMLFSYTDASYLYT